MALGQCAGDVGAARVGEADDVDQMSQGRVELGLGGDRLEGGLGATGSAMTLISVRAGGSA